MDNTTLKELLHKCMSIDSLTQILSKNYDTHDFNIDMVNDGELDEFRATLNSELFNMYINVDEISQETKAIKKYALGITDPTDNEANVIRYDNEEHHNDKKTVQEQNPPHHKHIGKDERVLGSNGKVEDILKDIEEKIKNIEEQ